MAAAFLRNKLLVIPVLLAAAVGLYALGGFWLVPKLIRSQATDYVGTELKKSLTLGEIKFNPFRFELDMRDIAIADAGARAGQPLVALKHLFVNFQVSSVWKGAYTFRKVAMDGPFARAIIRPDGSLNLADLVPESEDDSPLPEVWIEDLSVNRGRVNFADNSRRLKPEKTLSPIEFTLKDFRTASESGGFRLSAVSEQGERFDWSGRLSLQPLASTGKISVAAFKARSAYEFLSDELPFELTGGSFDLSANYRFSAGTQAGTQLDATLPRISATGLSLRARGVDSDWVTLPSAILDDTRLSLARHQVTIAALRVTGMHAKLWREADGSLNIDRLLAAPAATTASPAPAAQVGSAGSGQPAPGADWQLSLARFDLQQADLDVQDRTVKPAASFKLAPLAMTATGLSLDMAKPLPITLQTVINGVAPLSVSGEVVPETTAATLQIDLAKMPLRDVLAYLPDYPSLYLKSGSVGAKGTLSMLPADAPGPELGFSGDAAVADFDLVETAGKREFVSWQRVDVQGLQYTAAPDAVSIKVLTANKPYARVIIAPDQTINLVSVLGAATPATAQAHATAPADMPIKIGKVVLAAGVMAFADYSIDPNFQARIDALRGTITGLSSSTGSVAKIDLAGHIINRYSPVTITGETDIFAYDKHTDIKMAFKNIELPIFNPYSGRFAGYAIAKGKLSTELHYKIDKRALVAEHHVILDQLQWGAATDSKDKVSLPIRLATALLKDRHGVIDLSLPVTGTLDDPKFRVGPVVWQIIKNIVVKIVTAPFSFLGSLFKGAEDAQFVDFAPGSSTLSDKAKTSLPALAKSLADRPALNLDIPAGPAAEADAAAITDQRLQAAVAALRGGKQGEEAPAYATLDAGDKLDALKDLYKQQFDKKAEIPEAPEAAEDATRKEKKADRQQAAIAWFEEQLRPRYKVEESELIALGQARAVAVQESLLAGGELDPTRVFMAAGQSSVAKDGVQRMELALK